MWVQKQSDKMKLPLKTQALQEDWPHAVWYRVGICLHPKPLRIEVPTSRKGEEKEKMENQTSGNSETQNNLPRQDRDPRVSILEKIYGKQRRGKNVRNTVYSVIRI